MTIVAESVMQQVAQWCSLNVNQKLLTWLK